jgi:ketosteroid isomerase-like protein
MKTTLLLLAATLALLSPLRAADNPQLAKVTAADDDRVAAMRAGDRAKLTAIFSDELRYSHSSGNVDDKTSFIEVLSSGKTKYTGLDYEERKFTFPAPGIALMTGRAHVQVESANGKNDMILAFLGVWREEQGQWRFLAWQSCKLPAPTAPAK